MKHLLNGIAIAAVFAIAAPALAQNAPMTPAAPPAKTAPKTSGREAPAAAPAKRKLKLVHGKRSKTA